MDAVPPNMPKGVNKKNRIRRLQIGIIHTSGDHFHIKNKFCQESDY
jgi:hypothetical protein